MEISILVALRVKWMQPSLLLESMKVESIINNMLMNAVIEVN